MRIEDFLHEIGRELGGAQFTPQLMPVQETCWSKNPIFKKFATLARQLWAGDWGAAI
jgi:hypothetical protein